MAYHGGSCLHERFDIQAERSPENVAVECDGVQLTYRDLQERSAALAGHLGERLNAAGQFVALCIDRSVDLIVGLLGILRAGGAYVPIDPSYPPERIHLLLEDSGITTVVSRRADVNRLPDGDYSVILIDAADSVEIPRASSRKAVASDAAYVIYTSGSTGTPKGTVVEHRNVVRLFDSTREWFQFGPSDIWTMFHSISFDFSVWEIWGALLYGGRLVIVPSEVAVAPIAFAAFVAEVGTTVLNQTPTAFGQLARASIAANRSYPMLRMIVLGGERLDAAQLRPWIECYGSESPKLVNMYGITETTVHVTYRPMTVADLQHPELSLIGQPIPDLQVHLRDASGAEPAPGSPGEIIVTGAGVSRGYLNRPELTAERFPMLPLGPGGELVRAFRSGDLACRQSGDLIYLGRSDAQLKVRGYRVEPREIEIQLEACPEVENCAVIARDFGEGDTRLIAFVTPKAGFSGIADRVSQAAARMLPNYMCPSRVVEVHRIPCTANGKRDKDELWQHFDASSNFGGALISRDRRCNGAAGSVGRLVELAGAIFESDISPEVDLFDQGGTSLSLARLLLAVNAEFELSLTGAELEGNATIGNLGSIVDRFLMASKCKNT